MPATQMRVSLLSVTPNAEALVYANAKQCTSADDAFSIYTQAVVDKKNDGVPFVRQQDIIRRVMASGHLGIVEPVVFTFAISGVSRALSHQLVRHRLASYSQQSQRYVKADGFGYVVPPQIAAIPEAAALFEDAMVKAQLAYNDIVVCLHRHWRNATAAEDARFVLPNACETKVVVTMNARSLLHFFEQRGCMRAQWEIRALANEMLRICKEAVPVIFEKAGARCERRGYCEEEKGCGRYPKLKDVMEKYKGTCNG